MKIDVQLVINKLAQRIASLETELAITEAKLTTMQSKEQEPSEQESKQ